MENFRWELQTKKKANWQGRCGMVDSRNTTGVLLDGQRCGNLGRNQLGKNRLEWRC